MVVVHTIDFQFLPDFTPGLGGITLESLQQGHHFCLSLLLCPPNGIRLGDIPRFPEIHLPPRGNPQLDDVKGSIVGSIPQWSFSKVVRLIWVDP